MYGGGFATIPAYLADIFGTHHVGAVHGRLLTAWSTAGVLGPVLVNYIREYQLAHGVARAAVYNQTMYVLAGLLLCGLICNLLVRPCAETHYMSDEEVAAQKHIMVAESSKKTTKPTPTSKISSKRPKTRLRPATVRWRRVRSLSLCIDCCCWRQLGPPLARRSLGRLGHAS